MGHASLRGRDPYRRPGVETFLDRHRNLQDFRSLILPRWHIREVEETSLLSYGCNMGANVVPTAQATHRTTTVHAPALDRMVEVPTDLRTAPTWR
mmetsp:Transcript_38180/g.107884  ORF Transcript_38180/g.107884 Transcript_38180/m.107884 type:complete len:95 (-) Transcript_38180:48-332(-)